MGLQADFRNALASIASAIPDAAHTLRHGYESGAVVQTASREFADPVSDKAPEEATRVIADAAIFPTVEHGSAVEFDGSLRVITSLKSDAVGATFTMGLSAPFEKCAAAISGTRRVANTTQTINFKLDVLLLESGTAESYTNALAPSYAHVYLVGVRRADWGETTDPEPGDNISVAPEGYELALKVSTVTRHDGWYILRCRTKG